MLDWIRNFFVAGARSGLQKSLDDLQASLDALKQTEEQLKKQQSRLDHMLNTASIGARGDAKIQREQVGFQLEQNRIMQKQLEAKILEVRYELNRTT